MNACPIDDHALQHLVAELEATPPRPHHSGLLETAGRALPGQPFRFVLSRGGWYRPGGIVRASGERVADHLETWAEAEVAGCDGDMDSFIERHGDAGLVATRHSGRTHYFVAPYGPAPADFLQLEIEELHEVLDRRLFSGDDPPADLQELIDPLQPSTLEAHPVAPPHYRFRRLTDMRYVVVRLPAPVGQIHPLSRFLGEWAGSQARSKNHFCDHRIIALRASGPLSQPGAVCLARLAARPQAQALPLGSAGARGGFRQPAAGVRPRRRLSRRLVFPHGGGRPARDVAATLAGDLDAGFNYLREQDAKLLAEWMRAPYSA